MKKAILFTAALMAAILFVVFMSAQLANSQSEPANTPLQSKCPAGSYDIGISKDGSPICKLEPTGCPYGDSIPMDMCDKFKPQVEPVQPADTPTAEPIEPTECAGK